MTKIQELNSQNFDAVVQTKNKPVLVVFHAPWCGYCRMQLPIIAELADIMGDKAIIADINIDDNQPKAREYGVSGVPSLFIFKNGEVVYHQSGVHKKEDLKMLLEKYA